MSGFTVGHLLYAMAAIEVVVVPLMALNMMRANPDVPAASFYVVIAAAIATALGLCAFAMFSDFGRMALT
jgi:hypothetical protein